MRRFFRRRATAVLGGAAVVLAAACADFTTEAPLEGDVFDGPLPGLTPEELAAFVRGDEDFGRAFSPAEGLGPIFNNVSCASCHSGDGRGRVENALTRFSQAGSLVQHLGGPQLQDKAIPGAEAEVLPAGVDVSVRLPPPVFGVGLIEAISEAAILALADETDADGDGISGRPNWVTPPAFVPAMEPGGGSGPQLGRFSRKAQVSSLLQQTVEAYHQDIGITSDFLPIENQNPLAGSPTDAADRVADPEISQSTVRAVVHYIRTLAPPAPGADTPERMRGRALFVQLNCSGCHVPQLMTGPNPIAALARQPVTLYSDLLLHDMGDDLADNRPDGSANGREWRTAPLWGLRLMRQFLNGDAFLLHDGRARTIEEAILLHGGEAQAARDGFAALGPGERTAVLDFVGSR
ncbi:MAG: thiol oxidoreductase [Gemmatimonadales bacterium]|nr:thiol oxidoreductase [Gemmatimonadales bacterium]